ncbi:DNA polymerase III subunit beta [Saprospiraceae bacterium]|nr:DNA polymerase III subunit beta [Saprospiraceae bacterium]
MKFTISSSDLSKTLGVASGVIGTNAVLPIMEDFLFDIKGNQLEITATNLENTISTKLEVQASEDMKVAIPAKILIETMKALPEQPVTFDVNADNFAIELTTAFGKYKLAGDNPDEFPETSAPEDAESITVPGSTLNKAIAKTIFATSNDELRLAMMGVLLQIDFNSLTFVATDAHKLVKYKFGNVSTDQNASLILPKKGLSLLKACISDSKEVKLSFNKKNVFFTFDETTIVCRLIDAKYPDYNAVIPIENPNVLGLPRTDFMNSLKRINIFANKTTNQAILNLSEGSLTISSQDLDFSNEATEQLSCEYNGEALAIGFNAKFLGEMLNVMDTKNIELHMSTSNRAGILVPAEQDEGEDLLMLVMPVMMSH